MVPLHDPAPGHAVVHAHALSQKMPSLQLPVPPHVTVHAPLPHRTCWPHAPGPEQLTSHAAAASHCTPAAHAFEPAQRTSHGMAPGHITCAAHSPAPHSMMQVPSVQRVHTLGHAVEASISPGSITHQPSTQSRPGAHSLGLRHSKSSERESMLQAGASAIASATAAAAEISAAIGALTSGPREPARCVRGR